MIGRTTTICLLAAALAIGCTARDFFGYRDDAPLHAIDKPDDYPTSSFGSEIASTFFHSDESFGDLLAVSGGRTSPTLFYWLSENGSLVDVVDPTDEYLMNHKDLAVDYGSGAALVGLPTWTSFDEGEGELVTGCVAIGEQDLENVHLYCLAVDPSVGQQATEFDIPGTATGAEEARRFGGILSSIRPVGGAASWLLAVASANYATVFSAATATHRSEPMYPTYEGVRVPGIVEIAGGALSDGRFFVAAATAGEEGTEPPRVHLFLQSGSGATEIPQVACVNRSGEDGFGGSMLAADLDGDGDDELVISAGSASARENAVYIYEVADLAAAAPTCNSDAGEPAATIVPGPGALDVGCGPGCGFGRALAVGDIATDDEGPELLVGAPGATVDGVSGAGAVYIYRAAEVMAGDATPAGRVADSAPEEGAGFGGSVIAAQMAGRLELITGAVANGQVFIAYCTGVGHDIEQGADVTKNGSGKVVSTRCRLR